MYHFRYRIVVITAVLLAGLFGCTTPSDTVADPTPDSTEEPAVRHATLSEADASPLPLLSSDNPDVEVQQQVLEVLDTLAAKGFDVTKQGVWIQTNETLLANVRGTQPFPAASVTKIATTLAALRVFEVDRRFATEFKTTGTVENGVLEGDLVVVGDFDPMFVWEDAIEVGNVLHDLGIDRVSGDLIIAGNFYMNFEEDVAYSGELLQQGLNAKLWTLEAETQYRTLPSDTPRPQVEIAGTVRVVSEPPAETTLLVRHESVPVAELLKLMNRYSNNAIAHTFAKAMGGSEVVVREVLAATGVPADELQLINGSGLGEENQISPRTAVAMYLAINRELESEEMTVSDVVAIAGLDNGILLARPLPRLATIKSGSLNGVSTISGGLPTRDRGVVWFAMMNGGTDTETLRSTQERLLQTLESQWGAVETPPKELATNDDRTEWQSRNEVVAR
ncbi:D-alanyl-D-alanine carboxypeptidase [Baaleninema simplex]|uniref:D-alanyl-D-alanine carboxypeptidase n=1 Tax=Baaleninema simplex TaxID=2862350 RepID=UPI0003489CA2|nr:D-alanyl-D-alanine carboxypeptidase [Baaleninema simplex]